MHYSANAIPWIGTAMIATWLAAWAIACGRITAWQGCLVGALTCSPVVLLALERGNTDLIIFCLVVLAIWLLGRERIIGGWTALLIATTLKLFPLFGFVALLRLNWRRAWPWLAAGALASSIMIAIQSEQIRGVLRETPPGGIYSYGAIVWVEVTNLIFANKTGTVGAFDYLRIPSLACAAALIVTAFSAGTRRRSTPPIHSADRAALDYFRAGASIFIATFLFGSHFVYRLVFLLLSVPWLLRAAQSEDRTTQRMGWICLALLAVALWANPHWALPFCFVRDTAVWCLAGGLAWFLGRTLPADLRLWKQAGATRAASAKAAAQIEA
jgi:hypothetical protein